MFIQLIPILHKIHSQGFVHRDIKLDNLKFAGSDIKLLDFGISSRIGVLMNGGTLEYMSPLLLIRGHGLVEQSEDWFAVAVILFKLLCGVDSHPYYTAQDLKDLNGMPPGQKHNLEAAARMVEKRCVTWPEGLREAYSASDKGSW